MRPALLFHGHEVDPEQMWISRSRPGTDSISIAPPFQDFLQKLPRSLHRQIVVKIVARLLVEKDPVLPACCPHCFLEFLCIPDRHHPILYSIMCLCHRQIPYEIKRRRGNHMKSRLLQPALSTNPFQQESFDELPGYPVRPRPEAEAVFHKFMLTPSFGSHCFKPVYRADPIDNPLYPRLTNSGKESNASAPALSEHRDPRRIGFWCNCHGGIEKRQCVVGRTIPIVPPIAPWEEF